MRSSGSSSSSSMGRPTTTDTTKLYETLGVQKSASDQDIKKAYRKLAVQHHPDKGGDEHRFKEINAAYQVLSDQEQRAVYDRHGLDGLSGSGGGGGGGRRSYHDHHTDMEDLFDLFFGAHAAAAARRRQAAAHHSSHSSTASSPPPRPKQRGDDVRHILNVSLEDLYKGKTVSMAIHRQVLVGTPIVCHACRGQGSIYQLRPLGFGLVQQVEQSCTVCNQEGYCCRTQRERTVITIDIERGMRHEQNILAAGMGDAKANTTAGNIIFVVHQKPHSRFHRRNSDLLLHKRLSLRDALTGFQWMIPHLDGRMMCVTTRPGEIIYATSTTSRKQPYVKVVPNEGMPIHHNDPFERGDLYIAFEVVFPIEGSLSSEAIRALRLHLPGLEGEEENGNDHNFQPKGKAKPRNDAVVDISRHTNNNDDTDNDDDDDDDDNDNNNPNGGKSSDPKPYPSGTTSAGGTTTTTTTTTPGKKKKRKKKKKKGAIAAAAAAVAAAAATSASNSATTATTATPNKSDPIVVDKVAHLWAAELSEYGRGGPADSCHHDEEDENDPYHNNDDDDDSDHDQDDDDDDEDSTQQVQCPQS